MNRRNIIRILGILMMSVLLLSACGTRTVAPDPTPAPTPEPTPPPTDYTITTESAEEILALANNLSLEKVDATQSREYDAILKLHEMRPSIEMTWNYEFQGKVYPSDTTELKVTDLTGLEDAIRYLPEVNYIDLIESDATVEDLDRFDAIRPGIFYYWSFVFNNILMRTDILVYSSLRNPHLGDHRFTNEELYPMLKYCKRLRALDLGHNDLTDLTLIGELSDLEVLILGDNPNLVDASPMGKLTKLHYLEFFMEPNVEDFSWLNNLVNMESLELCYAYHLTSMDFLANMPKFKIGMFKYSGILSDEFMKWYERLPEGAWMILYDGDVYSCSSGWRDVEKNHYIVYAFNAWRNLTDYRYYDDFDCDFTQYNYKDLWELEHMDSMNYA